MASGAIVEARSYDAWGKIRQINGADDSSGAIAQASSEPTALSGQEYVKPLALVNLNARMYDPAIGRFLAPDAMNGRGGQGLNPYSYVQNNPLTDSDPSGMCGFFACPFRQIFGKGTWFAHNASILRPVAAIVAVATFQTYILPTLGIASSSFEGAALSGAVGGAVNTGTLRGTLLGAGTAVAFFEVGNIKGSLGNSFADGTGFDRGTATNIVSLGLHAAVGCVSSAVGGGRCGSGAISGGLGDLTTQVMGPEGVSSNPFVNAAVAGLGGGTGAALTGGRFGDGFAIAAAGYLYNCMAGHECYRAAAGEIVGPEVTGPKDHVFGDPASLDRRSFPDTKGNTECVQLCKSAFEGETPGSTTGWIQGTPVLGDVWLKPGTLIATFTNGKYDGGHAGIYMGQNPDGSVVMRDQWNAKPEVSDHTLSNSSAGRVNRPGGYYTIRW